MATHQNMLSSVNITAKLLDCPVVDTWEKENLQTMEKGGVVLNPRFVKIIIYCAIDITWSQISDILNTCIRAMSDLAQKIPTLQI